MDSVVHAVEYRIFNAVSHPVKKVETHGEILFVVVRESMPMPHDRQLMGRITICVESVKSKKVSAAYLPLVLVILHEEIQDGVRMMPKRLMGRVLIETLCPLQVLDG
jgi:hypothetical protein